MDSIDIHIDFHNRAKEVFFAVYNDFLNAVNFINRNNNEVQYQQLYNQHITHLKRRLEGVAKEVLTRHQDQKRIDEINMRLNAWVSDYLHQFRQKIRE
jgi:hypothetical protein